MRRFSYAARTVVYFKYIFSPAANWYEDMTGKIERGEFLTVKDFREGLVFFSRFNLVAKLMFLTQILTLIGVGSGRCLLKESLY